MNGPKPTDIMRAEPQQTAESIYWLGLLIGVACGFGLGMFVAAVTLLFNLGAH